VVEEGFMKLRRVHQNIIIAFLSSVIALSIAELFLWFLIEWGIISYSEIPLPKYLSIRSHPYLPYVWKENHESHKDNIAMRTNNYGIVGNKNFAFGPQEHKLRIMCLGGSTTYNPGTTFDSDWPHLLGKKISQEYPEVDVEVFNLAGMGYTLADSMARFITLGQRYYPDIIIIFHTVNDVAPGRSPNFRTDYSHFKMPYREDCVPFVNYLKPFPSWKLYSLLRYTLIKWFGKEHIDDFYGNWSAEVWDRPLQNKQVFRENLETIITLGRARGTRIVLTKWNYSRDPSFRTSAIYLKGIEELQAVTESVAREYQTYYIRVDDVMPDDPKYYLDFCHYTDLGLEKMASVFYENLRELVIQILQDKHLVSNFSHTETEYKPSIEQ